ncbi:hypothetical protein [Nakamurella endophytica]|uniref:Uncharacterized protein n=1 Tax=Nakamurella endophytica TaxID=1748367 RepID=A0A917SYJ0_9ACTN|nr:hypothetical protein [Nakamurella endophytica]GGM02712.1 hypothetical protein GCM10011594_23530 [Nakamurella endophytica]
MTRSHGSVPGGGSIPATRPPGVPSAAPPAGPVDGSARRSGQTPECVLDATRRLAGEFAGTVPVARVRSAVQACHDDLCDAGVHPLSMGELLERAARVRLREATGRD